MFVVERTGVSLASALETASTRWQRVKGLLGRSALSADGGLLIRPCRAVHTWFMRFSIDVVFVDRTLRVVRVVHRLAPFRTASGGRQAHAVIELPAGRAAASGLVEGDRLHVAPEVAPDRAGIR
jgi:uncharacterized membrane protein (UPF0127 family)